LSHLAIVSTKKIFGRSYKLGEFFAKVAYKIRTALGGVVNYVDEDVKILDDEIHKKYQS
jgi:hypothetical protein